MTPVLTASTPLLAYTIRIVQVERIIHNLRLARETHIKRPNPENAARVARWETALNELGGVEK